MQVTGGGNCTLAAARAAMGIDWMTKGEIDESLPPAYTELVGKQLLSHLAVDHHEMAKAGRIAPPGSKERIRRFMLAHIGKIVTSIQIRDAVGADVSEWARRRQRKTPPREGLATGFLTAKPISD